jgi:ABC-type lipoprotein release transport system permease subunit
MKLLLKTAVRTLLRNPRRTAITVLSIAMSLAVLFWIQSIIDTRTKYLLGKVLSLSGGDLQVFSSTYSEDKRLADVIRSEIPAMPDVLGPDSVRTDRIRLPGLVAAAEESFPIYLNGIDPENEPKVTRIREFLTKGEFLAPDRAGDCADRPIYIGERLAKLLRVGVGDKIVFLGQAADGTLGNELLRVKGLFDSKGGEFDKVYAFTTLACTKKIGVLGGVHETAYKLRDASRIEWIEESANRRLPPDLVAIGWKRANPMIAQVIHFNDGIVGLLTAVLVSIVIFGTVNTLLMSVHERSKEFGVMLALGMQPRQLMITIVVEAFLLSIVGLAIGLVVGGIAVAYHRWAGFDVAMFVGRQSSFQGYQVDTTMVYPEFALVAFLKASAIMVFFVTLAGLFPAYRAGKLTPVDTIRG